MAFKDTTLIFKDYKIAIDDNRSVMMDWETPIMEKSAEYICQSKGDILEIGFGMGICADFIQAEGIKSHTIIELHPQVIEKLRVWAEDKDNVITWAVTSGTIYWAGGGVLNTDEPTLTTTDDKTDILTFYFDGTNYFGVASLNFDTT